jgi:hypothetical protein
MAVAVRLVVKVLARDFAASKSIRVKAFARGLNIETGMRRSLA